MENSCYNCRFHFVESKKLGCTFPGICHTPDGRKLAYEPIEVNWNKIGRYLAVSADEAVCAMKQLNELAKTVGPYSEEELKLRRINGKRKKIWKRFLFL